MQHAHRRQARLANLSCPYQIEAAIGRKLDVALTMLDKAKATGSGPEAISGPLALQSKIAAGHPMRNEAADREVGIRDAEPFHELPKRTRIAGTLLPTGKIGAAIDEGQAGRHVKTDDCVTGHFAQNPVQHILS